MTGTTWPASRVCWAVIASAATVLVLNSGVASYDGVVWSVTVTQQAVTSMIIPLAIALARPWDLFTAPGVRRRRRWIAFAALAGAGRLHRVDRGLPADTGCAVVGVEPRRADGRAQSVTSSSARHFSLSCCPADGAARSDRRSAAIADRPADGLVRGPARRCRRPAVRRGERRPTVVRPAQPRVDRPSPRTNARRRSCTSASPSRCCCWPRRVLPGAAHAAGSALSAAARNPLPIRSNLL